MTTSQPHPAGQDVGLRVCIYTAIYGAYDELKQPTAQSMPECDFICFTDAAWPARIGAWRIIRSGLLTNLHPRMRAKYFKCMSHEVFPNGRLAWRFSPFSPRHRYAYLIWIDGSIAIKSQEFASGFVRHVGANGLSMFAHPERDCIYEELEASLGMVKYAGLPIAEQVDSYSKEGFPKHAGLMAMGLIARRVGHPMHQAINEAWWAENNKWSYQDQLSFPVVLWRLRHGYDKVPLNLWDNPWFDWMAHKSDR